MAAVKPRRYESPRRREQAAATRAAILRAAHDVLLRRGFVGTTVGSVAAEAGVSPQTIYATFGGKRALLARVLDVAITGDDEDVPLLERAWVQKMRAEEDAEKRARLLARHGAAILERVTPIYEVLRGAAAADADMGSVWHSYKERRRAGQLELARIVTAGVRRKGLALDAAADILYGLGSPETYSLLVGDRAWPKQRFERWYGDAIVRLLLEPDIGGRR
ncbi:MAG TPA: helix-turn-helix domain-containing protein [Actinomycetota bacterium]|nr:helix-turn-helix domain-containing protein [Actinomycetota bacterium]